MAATPRSSEQRCSANPRRVSASGCSFLTEGTRIWPTRGAKRWSQTRKGTMRVSIPCMIMPTQPQSASHPKRTSQCGASSDQAATAASAVSGAISRPACQKYRLAVDALAAPLREAPGADGRMQHPDGEDARRGGCRHGGLEGRRALTEQVEVVDAEDERRPDGAEGREDLHRPLERARRVRREVEHGQHLPRDRRDESTHPADERDAEVRLAPEQSRAGEAHAAEAVGHPDARDGREKEEADGRANSEDGLVHGRRPEQRDADRYQEETDAEGQDRDRHEDDRRVPLAMPQQKPATPSVKSACTPWAERGQGTGLPTTTASI